MGARIGHYGGAVGNIDKANCNPVEVFKSFGPHKALPSRKDIPHLLKMLSVGDPGVSSEAHRALVWLTGVDVGRDRARWQVWWQRHGRGIAREEDDREEVGNLFRRFRGDVLTGRWTEAVGRLSLRVREGMPDEKRVEFMAGCGQMLRRVYRDARVAVASVNGDRGRLKINWGELGFEFDEIEAVREPEGWCLDRLPWARRVVRQCVEAEEAQACRSDVLPLDRGERAPVPRKKHGGCPQRRSRWRGNAGGLIAVLLAAGLVFGAIFVVVFGSAEASRWMVALGFMGIVGAVPAMLFYGMIFDRFRSSRDIRHDLHQLSGRYAPHARGRR